MRTVHLIDKRTPHDMMAQLRLLVRDYDVVLSVGESDYPPKGVKCVKKLFPACRTAKLLAGLMPENAILQVWSYELLDLASRVAELSGAKLLLTLPGLPLGKKALKYLPWDLGRFGASITLPTQAARQKLVDMKADPRHIFVLPPTAEIITDHAERRKRMRASLGIGPETLTLATAGPLHKMGPQKMAAWAHGILRNVVYDLKLIYPGKGPHERNIRNFAATTGYVHDIFYTADRYDHIDALCAADVVLCCNVEDVGISGAATAMAARCATVISDTVDLRDFTADKPGATLTCRAGDPANAAAVALKLLEDPQKRQELADRAAEAMRNSTPQIVREKLEDIYSRVK